MYRKGICIPSVLEKIMTTESEGSKEISRAYADTEMGDIYCLKYYNDHAGIRCLYDHQGRNTPVRVDRVNI